VGTADRVLGVARGIEDTDRFYWTYNIDLSVPGGTLKLNFNDWMWMIDERRILNFACMKKLEVNIGKEVIFFKNTLVATRILDNFCLKRFATRPPVKSASLVRQK